MNISFWVDGDGSVWCFFQFFIDKITKLRNSVSNALRSLPASLPCHESFPPHFGPVFDILSPVTADEVRKLLSSSLPKSPVMDINRCQSVFSEIIAHLANLSFSITADSLINSNKLQSHHCLRVVLLISPFYPITD